MYNEDFALLKHNIYPDFVMVVDPIDYTHVLDGMDCAKIPGLIIADTCHPKFYALPFQNIFSYFDTSSQNGVTEKAPR